MEITSSGDFYSVRQEFNKIATVIISYIKISCNGKQTYTNAMWDTGASRSAVSSELLNSLGASPHDARYMQTPAGIRPAGMYSVDIAMSNEVHFENVDVAEADMTGLSFQAIIGMDIISQGNFLVDNSNGHTVMIFEVSKETIDES